MQESQLLLLLLLAYKSGSFAPNEFELHLHWVRFYKMNVKTIYHQRLQNSLFSRVYTDLYESKNRKVS